MEPMILRKVVNDEGKIVYEPIEFKEAVHVNKDELVFTDEEEKERYDDFQDEEEDNSPNQSFSFDFSKLANLGKKTNRIFRGNQNTLNPKNQRLMGVLPFMDDEDIAEIVNEIINHSEEYKDLPLVAIMPFLSSEDADRLFMEFVVNKTVHEDTQLISLAPFVSETCLDKFVDEYVNGKYQQVDMDALYPFMGSKTIKKLFKYVLNKKENQ
jgi:hypothetical protein